MMPIKVDRELFQQRVREFFATGGDGLNITIPFKLAAWQMATMKAVSAQVAQAANTLYIQNGDITAANTDGEGLVRDIQNNLSWQLKGEDILILGAGGFCQCYHPCARRYPTRHHYHC